MRHLGFLTFFVIICFEISSAQSVAGSIAGAVIDGDGKSVPAATVSFQRLAEFSRDSEMRLVRNDPGISGVLMSQQDGTFLISGLVTGRYMVCARGPNSKSLTGCGWEATAVIKLGQGENVNKIVRRTFEGSSIVFRVSDPQQKVSLPDTKGNLVADRRLFVGVVSPQGFYRPAIPATFVAGATSTDFRVVVPKRQSFRLFLDSDLTITDNLGNAIERQKASDFFVSPGTSDEIIVDLGVR